MTARTVRRNALLILAVFWMSLLSVEAFRPPALLCPKRTATTIATASRLTRLRSSPGEDEDDGWGRSSSSSEASTTPPKKNSFETDQKLRELRYLREEASRKASSSYEPSGGAGGGGSSSGGDRDLFIPILSVVSLMGLFGAYGYETLRLASRGELYLPF